MGFLSVLSQAQRYVAEHIRPGDAVIDATAGNGVDTLFLSKATGAKGHVFAFDIQATAIEQTRNRLQTASDTKITLSSVTLLNAGHETMIAAIPPALHGNIAAVMFNLGYLPGAQQTIITQTNTTLLALNAALTLLRSSGILTIVVYPGHEGGDSEAKAVEKWAEAIPTSVAQCVIYRFPQKLTAPYLIAVTKK
ncbi:MAG: class I SAM-dependent methyltransferase [Candidatus Cohnella colombiensis]|uniref:Class I SAM-dependent methyltransferase n=1 Tax=Candidatus Cohnella colombiensis TaxID=3121368 RepID=A0AA95EYH8_9BACL|nr:MAG: class I SAM-dependent methyltransferase [Cohnella sp.]